MKLRQLQYAVMLAETCSFSQLAEKLSISQPALSKQIISLENELGIKLFNRDTNPLTLTPAGEYYIREAKELLYREEQLLRSLERFKSGEAGRLTIGISPFRSPYLMPRILQKVRDRYPGIQITVWEATSDELRKEAAEGKYDFAVVNLPVDETALDVIPLAPDTLVLAVPNRYLDKLPFVPKGNMPMIDLRDCKELPFVAVSQTQELRKLFDSLCAAAGFSPNVVAEIKGGLVTASALVIEGVGAALLPLRVFMDDIDKKDVTMFALKEKAVSRQPVIVMKKGKYLPEYVKFAIELLTE